MRKENKHLCERQYATQRDCGIIPNMKRCTQTPRKVLIDISLLHASGRDIISGIFRHMETVSRLEPRLLQNEENPITPDKVKSVVADGIAGIIMTSMPSKAIETALSKATVPVVLIGVRSQEIESKHSNVSIILNDNAGIGTMAAEYLLHHGQFRIGLFGDRVK